MQIKFSDSTGTTLTVLAINGQSINFQGANRDGIEIQIAKDAVTFDALDKLTADPANLKKLMLIDGDKQYIHDDYSLRAGLSLKPVVTAAAASTTPEQTEDRLCVTLAQKTYAELQQEQTQAAVDTLTLSALGVG